MEMLISTHIRPLSTRSTLKPPSFSPPIPFSVASSLRRRPRNPKPTAATSSPAAPIGPPPSCYGGWDDLALLDDSDKLDPFRTFLISLGIDRNHAVVFVLGFISSLAVSRGRLSSAGLLPVSILVFAAGFLAGAARAGAVSGFLDRIRWKDGDFGGFDGNVRDFGAFLDDLDVKMSDLRSGLEGVIGSEGYIEVVEYVRSASVSARKSMEDSVVRDYMISGKEGGGKKLNQKPGRKRRDAGLRGFDAVRYFSSLFEEYLVGAKPSPSKGKDTSKGEDLEQLNSTTEEDPALASSAKRVTEGNGNAGQLTGLKPLPDSNFENSKPWAIRGSAPENPMIKVNPIVLNGSSIKDNAAAAVVNGGKSHARDGGYDSNMLPYDEGLQMSNRSLRFTTKQESFENLVYKHARRQTPQNGSTDFGRRPEESMDFFASGSGASTMLQQTLEIHDRSYFASDGSKSVNSKIERIHDASSRQAMPRSKDNPALNNQPTPGTKDENMPSSSAISMDEEFSNSVKEGTDLLKRAKECIMSQADEETADNMLYRSAKFLSAAVALRPMSLLAVGQLGNTYLLHGELKLKISRELRTLLSRSDALVNGKARLARIKKLDSRALTRENVSSVLVDVCEECEGFLVDAGRNYRKALSIDGNDIRALYNWGLALSFRAQLISDIGPEAALDADKVYLAAIDKFNAMVSRSNAYAPDALYRWGMALQLRSHLRPHNSRERIKLLQQAKSLFEDVLYAEPDNQHVTEALSSCLSELNYNGQW